MAPTDRLTPAGSRAARVVVALAFAAAAVGGCASDRPVSVTRPYPEGNPAASSRPLNPFAAQIDPSPRRPLVPGQIVIPAIGVNARVAALGTTVAADPFLGGRSVTSFEVPADLSTVGWWRDGARLGGPGMAVLLGHSQVDGGYAVFNELSRLSVGDAITVETSDGRQRAALRVTRVITGIPKDDESALQSTLSTNAETSDLALITCSGPFASSVSESEENTAVFARLG